MKTRLISFIEMMGKHTPWFGTCICIGLCAAIGASPRVDTGANVHVDASVATVCVKTVEGTGTPAAAAAGKVARWLVEEVNSRLEKKQWQWSFSTPPSNTCSTSSTAGVDSLQAASRSDGATVQITLEPASDEGLPESNVDGFRLRVLHNPPVSSSSSSSCCSGVRIELAAKGVAGLRAGAGRLRPRAQGQCNVTA